MTILADLSKYDPDATAAQYDGVILNVEDPSVAAKAGIARGAGHPVMLYSWVYPGGGVQAVQHGVAVAQSVGVPVCGVWLDYEQVGVVPGDLVAAHQTDTAGFRFGVYAYLAMMNTQGQALTDAIGDWPLWMAYYPGANDGTYDPSYSVEARDRGAVLHQFTSTNGTRDLSFVLDTNWYQTWTGAPVPVPVLTKGDAVVYQENKDDGTHGYWIPGTGGLLAIEPGEAYAHKLAGVPFVEYPTLGIIGLGARLKTQLKAALV